MASRNLFTQHPASVGETYPEHLLHAMGFAVRMLCAGVCCLIHALLPFLFEKTASEIITELHDRMVSNRAKSAAERQPP